MAVTHYLHTLTSLMTGNSLTNIHVVFYKRPHLFLFQFPLVTLLPPAIQLFHVLFILVFNMFLLFRFHFSRTIMLCNSPLQFFQSLALSFIWNEKCAFISVPWSMSGTQSDGITIEWDLIVTIINFYKEENDAHLMIWPEHMHKR